MFYINALIKYYSFLPIFTFPGSHLPPVAIPSPCPWLCFALPLLCIEEIEIVS